MLVDVDGLGLGILGLICNGVDTYKKVVPGGGNSEIMGSGTEYGIRCIEIFIILIVACSGTWRVFI